MSVLYGAQFKKLRICLIENGGEANEKMHLVLTPVVFCFAAERERVWKTHVKNEIRKDLLLKSHLTSDFCLQGGFALK